MQNVLKEDSLKTKIVKKKGGQNDPTDKKLLHSVKPCHQQDTQQKIVVYVAIFSS